MQQTIHPSSYRDPSGFVFTSNGKLYRQINKSFAKEYDQFITDGLYQQLVDMNLLIRHTEAAASLQEFEDCYKVIEPEFFPFVSFPYEWCFAMWKDAALVTLAIANEALQHEMIVKDASAYNVQWHGGKMKFIDTLSFIPFDQKPWIAYRQFCEHFLAPLALMHYLQQPMQPLFYGYPDGIPLPFAKTLLPFRSRFHLHTFLNLHLNASYKKINGTPQAHSFSKNKLLNILQSLEAAVLGYSYEKPSGTWSEYYTEASARDAYLHEKKQIVSSWIDQVKASAAIDLGANEGEFSLIAARAGIYTISADGDHYSVNQLYKKIVREGIINVHPVVIDLVVPSAAIGVNNMERSSFLTRAKVDLALALAVIHHLCIGHNIPFSMVVQMLVDLCDTLIIEFVPKEDPKVQLMLQHKADIYGWYNKENFLSAFSAAFTVLNEQQVGQSGRTILLMKKK